MFYIFLPYFTYMTNNVHAFPTYCSNGTTLGSCPDERSYDLGIEGLGKILSEEKLEGKPLLYPGHCEKCQFYLTQAFIKEIEGLKIEEIDALKLMRDIAEVAKES